MLMQEDWQLKGSWRWAIPLACFIAGTTIGLAGYFDGIPIETRRGLRLVLCLVFLAGLFIFKRNKPAWHTDLAFLAVSAGLWVAGLTGGWLLRWSGISGENARGFAVDKINETIPIIIIILLAVLLSGKRLTGLFLAKGQVGLSLLGGLGVGVILFGYFLFQGGWQVFQGSNLRLLLPEIGWITIFAIFNGFMEELWFRGLFLSRFEDLMGKRLAFWITALLFGMLHAFGNFTGTLSSLLLVLFTLLLGMAFCYIVQRTRSIWGAVLGHFFADFFFLLGYFATMG